MKTQLRLNPNEVRGLAKPKKNPEARLVKKAVGRIEGINHEFLNPTIILLLATAELRRIWGHAMLKTGVFLFFEKAFS